MWRAIQRSSSSIPAFGIFWTSNYRSGLPTGIRAAFCGLVSSSFRRCQYRQASSSYRCQYPGTLDSRHVKWYESASIRPKTYNDQVSLARGTCCIPGHLRCIPCPAVHDNHRSTSDNLLQGSREHSRATRIPVVADSVNSVGCEDRDR